MSFLSEDPSGDTRGQRWLRAWLTSDLIGIPLTLLLAAIFAGAFALDWAIGGEAGGFASACFLTLGFIGLFLLLIPLSKGSDEKTDEIAALPTGAPRAPNAILGPRRVLVVANQGLSESSLRRAIYDDALGHVEQALLIVPVTSSALHLMTDDVDQEMGEAQIRLDAALGEIRRAGVDARGHVDRGKPMSSLLDGLREFPATEALMLRGGESGWRNAEGFADRVQCELGLPVVEIEAGASVTA